MRAYVGAYLPLLVCSAAFFTGDVTSIKLATRPPRSQDSTVVVASSGRFEAFIWAFLSLRFLHTAWPGQSQVLSAL
jgi:hypothetical protein